jgi:hypothetical protein
VDVVARAVVVLAAVDVADLLVVAVREQRMRGRAKMVSLPTSKTPIQLIF